MPTTICPACSEEVFVEAESEQGDSITCEECGSRLVVVGLDPFELDKYEDTEPDGASDNDDFQSYDYDDSRY